MTSYLEFKGYKDAGAPIFSTVDGLMSINYAAGQRGRFISNLNFLVATENEAHVVTGKYRVSSNATALPVVVFWDTSTDPWTYKGSARGPLLDLSSEAFQPFKISFATPQGVGAFRVELRAWAGSGTSEFTAVQLDPAEEPEPEPEPTLPMHEWTGFICGNQMTLQRPTTPEQALAGWPCLPVIAGEWGDNFFITVIRPKSEPEPSEPEPIE